MWTGSLFDCLSQDINLRHRQFEDNSVTGQCYSGNGAVITAQSIGPGVPDINMNGFCYTSQLRLQNVVASDNNKTITCYRVDENSERVIDNDTLVLTTGELIQSVIYPTIQCRPMVYLLVCRHC